MNDKVNVELVVPEIEESYNVLLPINKKIGTIIILLCKVVNEFSEGAFPLTETAMLYNASTMYPYQSDTLLYSTDIRNSTRLVLLSKGC